MVEPDGSHGAMTGRRAWLPRLAAICEIVGVLLAAIVAQRALLGALGVPSWKGTQAEMLEAGEADFLLLAKLAAIDQSLKYGLLLGLAFAIGWWHRRRPLERYGVGRAGLGWGELVRIGVALWSVGILLPGLLQALNDHLPWIGRGPDHWALFPASWSAEFLLYMAASSFLLVAIAEELAVRGYMLARLREEYGDAGALVLAALFFALAHGQYFKAELLSVGQLVSLVVGSLGAGYVLLRTGSLVPPIVAHMLANLPTPPGEWSEEIVAALALAVLIFVRRPVLDWARGCLRLLASHDSWGGTVFGIGALVAALAAVLLLQGRAPAVAAALLVVGVGGNALDRRAARRLAAVRRHSH